MTHFLSTTCLDHLLDASAKSDGATVHSQVCLPCEGLRVKRVLEELMHLARPHLHAVPVGVGEVHGLHLRLARQSSLQLEVKVLELRPSSLGQIAQPVAHTQWLVTPSSQPFHLGLAMVIAGPGVDCRVGARAVNDAINTLLEKQGPVGKQGDLILHQVSEPLVNHGGADGGRTCWCSPVGRPQSRLRLCQASRLPILQWSVEGMPPLVLDLRTELELVLGAQGAP